MKYTLILGGAGFIGSNLVREFLKWNSNIIVLDQIHFQNKRLKDVNDKIKIVPGHLNNITLLTQVFDQYEIERVIHLISGLTPSSSLENFKEEEKNVILPTVDLMELMKQYNVKRFLFLSSGGTVYGNYKNDGYYGEEDHLEPINYYGLSKSILEEQIKFQGRANNIDYLILRPSNPFGRFQNIYGKQGLISVILGKIITGQTLDVWGNGENIRDYISIDFLCKSIFQLCHRNIRNEIFNVGSGTGYSVNDIIHLTQDIADTRLNVRYYEARNIDTPKVILNIDKLKSVIDVHPEDLKQSISNYYIQILEAQYEK